MTPEYKIALLGFAFTCLALPFLVQALRRHTMRATDEAMYALLDDEPDYASVSDRPLPPRRARWLSLTIAAVFVSIAASIVVTIVAAGGAAPHTSDSHTRAAAKCPF